MLSTLNPSVEICAVTKGRSISEVEAMLSKHPEIRIIAENRWPDCEEKFQHFTKYQKHFIGPLQSNKIKKVLPLVDCIQSVDSWPLLEKISRAATKPLKFCFQVNISQDDAKHGISPEDLPALIERYQKEQLPNVKLVGLMTIGSRTGQRDYFRRFKQLFDQINVQYFPAAPLKILSMGMSDDYQTAIKEGATMVRLGRILF